MPLMRLFKGGRGPDIPFLKCGDTFTELADTAMS